MNDEIIKQVSMLKAQADLLQKNCTALERSISRLYDPKRGRKKVVSDEMIAHVLAMRQKSRNRKALAVTKA